VNRSALFGLATRASRRANARVVYNRYERSARRPNVGFRGNLKATFRGLQRKYV